MRFHCGICWGESPCIWSRTSGTSNRPFAFLATYTYRVSARAKLQHLPLAEALKQYTGEKNREKLQTLLEPIQRAADGSELIRELLVSRRLFQPQAMSIQQAYRFLKDVPAMEAAGLVVRVPDWWKARQPARPEVNVRIGQKQANRDEDGSLLDFSVDVALDGEPLSREERERILAATDGLALLRGKWVEINATKLSEALEQWQRLEQQYAEGVDFLQGMRMLAGAPIGGQEMEVTLSGWKRAPPATGWATC